MSNDEFMNKTYNNKHLSSIEEEDAETKDQTKGNYQPQEAKNNKADLGIPAGESPHGAVSKRRFHGGRRLVTGLWRGTFFDTTRPVIPVQPASIGGNGNCDYKDLRKGMGDVMDDTSEPNLATVSDNDKAEVHNGDRFQSLEKLSGDIPTPEEMDHTTAADFSSFLDLGSECWNAENASQTTLIDEDRLCSALPSPTEQENADAPEEAKVCQLSQEIVPPPKSGRARFRENRKRDTSGAILEEINQLPDIPEERNSCAERNTNSFSQNRSSDERTENYLPACQVRVKDHGSPKPTLPSISGSLRHIGAVSKNSNIRCTAQTNSKPPMASLVNEYKCNKIPKRDKSHMDLKNCSPADLTQNHCNYKSLEGCSETSETKVNCDQDKYSKRSFRKRRHLSKLLTPKESGENHATEHDIDALKGTVSKHPTQEAVAAFKQEIRKVSGKEKDKSGEYKSLLVQDRSGNTKSTILSSQNVPQTITLFAHENAKPNASADNDNAKFNTFDDSNITKPKNLFDHDNAKPNTFCVHDNAKPNTFCVHDNVKINTFFDHRKAKSNTYSVHESAQQMILPVNNKLNNFSVHDSAKPNTFSVDDNTKPYTLSVPDNDKPDTISIQTSPENLKSMRVQRESESKASAENRGPSTTNASNFADLNMQRTASDRVLSKLLNNKQSQEQRETTQSIFYKSKGMQADIAQVHHGKQLSSHQKPPNSVPLPSTGDLISANYDPNNPQLRGGHANINSKRPRKTLGTHDNLNKDVFDDINNKALSNLTKASYNRLSVSPSIVTKTHISLENQAGSSVLLHANILRATQRAKVNANLNSTSSYRASNGQEQDIRTSLNNQADTDSHISSESTSSKRSSNSSINTLQERNASAFSYLSNNSGKTNSQNRESSVDGEGYPKKKAPISSVRENTSQTHEAELVPTTSLRKIECHHIHVINDCPPSLVDEQGTQTEMTIHRQDTNKLSPPDSVNNRYRFVKPLACTSPWDNPVLSRFKEQEFDIEKSQPNRTDIDVVSPKRKGYNVTPSDSYILHKLSKDGSKKIDGKGKKQTTKKLSQVKKKIHPNYFMQEDCQPLTSFVTQQRESSDDTPTMRPNSANTQQLPPLGSENVEYFTTTYRDNFQDPEILKNSAQIDQLPRSHERAGVRQKNTFLESYQTHEEEQFYQKKPSDKEAPKRSSFLSKDIDHATRNQLHNPDYNRMFGSSVDKQRRSVYFDHRQVQPLSEHVPPPPPGGSPPPERMSMSEEPEISIRLQRFQTAPPSYTYPEHNDELEDVKRDKSSQCPDRWSLNYTASDRPATMIERRKYAESHMLPSRLYADSYYDPANNVISVVVKPVDVTINQRLRNIKVKIYRSPPRLPSISSMSKQRKERESNKTHSSVPLSRNIIDRRAANPPFNTTTSQESDERYQRMFGHRKLL